VSLFIATRGASHPWLCVPTIPDDQLPAGAVRELREVRAILRANAATLGEPCRLRAVVVTGPEVGGPHVAVVVSRNGRIGRVFPGQTLAASSCRAIIEARKAARRAARRAA